jgi:hypothetical protein
VLAALWAVVAAVAGTPEVSVGVCVGVCFVQGGLLWWLGWHSPSVVFFGVDGVQLCLAVLLRYSEISEACTGGM